LNRILHIILFFLLLTGIISSCRKDESVTNAGGVSLHFSTDTLFFDTVFSSFGIGEPMSVTRQLWVSNHNDKAVKTNISIKGTSNGSIKMNVDGKAATSVSGKFIAAHDSIVIFVQIYSSPGNNFIVADQILFETNGTNQDVDIVAYGRDAYYHDAEEITKDTVWPSDKPHVIYHSMLVDKGVTLTIPQGTQVHSHIESTLYVQGTLLVNGAKGKEVIFGGDRLDQDYSDITGQWIGIRLLPGSKDNAITYAIIKNGFVGIEIDSLPMNSNPNLTLKQSVITNMKAAGLVGFSSHILAYNNLISQCGEFTFYGVMGGNYELYYNTMVCYNLASSRQNPQFVLDNSPFNATFKPALNYRLVNNLIWGSLEEELLLNNNPDGNQTFTERIVQTNLFRTKLIEDGVNGNVINSSPLFKDTEKDDYTLNTGSPAKGKASVIGGINTDLLNVVRSNTAPTIGAYE